ncbi:peroxisome biogenesis factor 2 isoform X1 [Ornithorhynchus anatinus]|uniref:peroxisome biogenesis factor 2 isoform X1 n=1 Tax=Ornithorhynchus anatinus TaxID=9258 RepID=UPI0010A8F989|nr:peroxisome biogenesis factor 2 isoform X1 [Ornithorhynchus anatinus]
MAARWRPPPEETQRPLREAGGASVRGRGDHRLLPLLLPFDPSFASDPAIFTSGGGGDSPTARGRRGAAMGPEAERAGSAQPALRVSQLDALELDRALERLICSQLAQCFHGFRPGLLARFETELKALVGLLLWRFGVCSRDATAGQALLGIRYDGGGGPPGRRRKLGFAAGAVGGPWLEARAFDLCRARRPAPPARLGRWAARAAGLLKLAGLVNFLLFLRGGRFATLTERLLGLRCVSARPRGARQPGFDYVNRELLWHGFAEFLIFLLPLVDVRKLKARLRAWRLPAAGGAPGPDAPAPRAARACALCGQWPTLPHTVGCPHVFCYYCVKTGCLTDARFSCPACGAEARGPQPLRAAVEMEEVAGP